MQIVDLFYELARQSRKIRGFAYGKNHGKGTGSDFYPLLWLDDPIYARREKGAFLYNINFDVLGIPREQTDGEIERVQSEALSTTLAVVEKINKMTGRTSFSAKADGYITLRNYYDDNAAGVRCSVEITGPVPINRCEDDFDPTKELATREGLPSFSADNPQGCIVFNDKEGLPSFKMTDDPGEPMEGYAFYVDTSGNYILTKNGEYIAVLKKG